MLNPADGAPLAFPVRDSVTLTFGGVPITFPLPKETEMRTLNTFYLDADISSAFKAYALRQGVSPDDAMNNVLRFALASTISDMAAEAHLQRHAATPLPKGDETETA